MSLHLTPIGLLMIEHRNIESVIEIMNDEMKNMIKSNTVKLLFIDTLTDFIRVYADKSHHGKEENIFFKVLYGKDLSAIHKKYIDDLVEDHKMGRKAVKELASAKESYVKGQGRFFDSIIKSMKWLVDFYPRHIEKEDKHFFDLYLEYLTEAERDQMFLDFLEFGENGSYNKYEDIEERLKKIII